MSEGEDADALFGRVGVGGRRIVPAQSVEQIAANLGEEGVKIAGNGLLLCAGFIEQRVDWAGLGGRAEQSLAVEQEQEEPEGLRVCEIGQVERVRINLAAAFAVEAEGGEVGEDHPAAVVEFTLAGRVVAAQ